MEAIKEKWKRRLLYPAALLKWLVFSLLIGVAVGAVGALFHHAIEAVSALREAHGWLIFLLPLGGASIILLYRVCGMERDRGTNFVLAAVRENEPMRLRTAPLIIAATVITHLVGGSAGREGAALQMGGAISGRLGRWMRLDEKDERIITMCGMSAGFAALFGTPLAAAVFSMEMVSVGVMYYAAMVPCLLSALIARLTAGLLGAVPAAFDLAALPELSAPNMARLAVLGVLCALLSILFCTAMHQAARFYGRVTDKPVVRAVLGGALVLALTLLLGTEDYCGAGMEVIGRAVAGTARPEAFLLKIGLTALTLGAGFKGGEIVPSFFAGATFGCVAGPLLGLPASFGAAAGLTAVFCGVTNCPMTSILLAYELFGGAGLPQFALVCAVSFMLSGYSGLYSEQKIIYSKLRPEYINKKTD